jgi:hypothetical protein
MPRALLACLEKEEFPTILFVVNNPLLVTPTFGYVLN